VLDRCGVLGSSTSRSVNPIPPQPTCYHLSSHHHSQCLTSVNRSIKLPPRQEWVGHERAAGAVAHLHRLALDARLLSPLSPLSPLASLSVSSDSAVAAAASSIAVRVPSASPVLPLPSPSVPVRLLRAAVVAGGRRHQRPTTHHRLARQGGLVGSEPSVLPLPSVPVRLSFEWWSRRHQRPGTLAKSRRTCQLHRQAV